MHGLVITFVIEYPGLCNFLLCILKQDCSFQTKAFLVNEERLTKSEEKERLLAVYMTVRPSTCPSASQGNQIMWKVKFSSQSRSLYPVFNLITDIPIKVNWQVSKWVICWPPVVSFQLIAGSSLCFSFIWFSCKVKYGFVVFAIV